MEIYVKTNEKWRGLDWTNTKKVNKYKGAIATFREDKNNWIYEAGKLDGAISDPADWKIDTLHLLTEEQKAERVEQLIQNGYHVYDPEAYNKSKGADDD